MGRLEEAVEARLRGVALDPLDARLRMILGVEYTVMGKLDDALLQYEHALRLDPSNALVLGLGPALPGGPVRIHLARGQDAEAVRGAHPARGAPRRDSRRTGRDARCVREGRHARRLAGLARRWTCGSTAAQSIRCARRSSGPPLGDTDQALDWLERAYAERNPGLIYLRSERAFAGLQSNPRFVRIVKEMKLAPPERGR